MSETESRSWRVYANRFDSGTYCHVGSKAWVSLHEKKVHPVLVTEDPEGTYYGWLDRKSDSDEDLPSMIQCSLTLLDVCFPYGVDTAVKMGQGRIVRLRIEPRDED